MAKQMTRLDEKLQLFSKLVAEMGLRVGEAAAQAQQAVADNNMSLMAKIISDDAFIDQLRSLVESDGVRILVSEAPYGKAIRTVVAGMKIVTHLERVGDMVVKFSTLCGVKRIPVLLDGCLAMLEYDRQMIEGIQELLDEPDDQKAIQLAKLDDKVDALREDMDRKLLAIEPKDAADRAALYQYYASIKELERLGDHMTSVCSWIVYIVRGEKPNLNE